ncbi:MAG TPA: SusD/RagB family nutrient-binding outer membrane lipoprotein [Gemmatimonadales bacterium]|nr:SusD/RagB family nutrient-binding outer membrane lipoprotein [Gemmatimonadales bacterium]
MNRYAKAGTALALALLGVGCSDFLTGTGLTENPNNPTKGTALQQLIAMQSNMATRLEGQLARCAGVFTQQIIGSNNQQLSYCTQYAVTEADISGQMSAFYTGGGLLAMRNIQASAQASGDQFLLGIAKIWEGLAMGTATSVWGDLPYSEAVNPAIPEPNLDSQQSIYTGVQTRLDEGIAALTAAAAGASGNCVPAEGDLIYCATAVPRATQIARWIRAAYTLKARFHLHLVERNGVGEYALALAAAQLGISEAPTSAAQAMNGQAPGDFRTFHGSIQDFDANIWAEFLLQRQDLVAGNALVQILKTRADPRLAAYFDANAAGQFVGANQNNVAVPAGGSSVPSVINTAVRRQFTFRQPLVTWAENQLILAEAKFMTADSAGSVTNVNAVRTAVGLATLPAPTFVDVMTEKYIAMFQNIDAWSDYKRTCIPVLVPFGTQVEVLGRMPYGSGERTSNPHIPLPSAYPAGTTGSSPVRNWNDPNRC